VSELPVADDMVMAADFHARAKRGIKALLIRQVILQIFTFAGSIVITRRLGPANFGLFAIATFWVGALGMLGDFGLAASFIQRRAELTEHDLQQGFTLQLFLTTLCTLALFVSAPWLVTLYPKAPSETLWLIRVLAFSLLLTSWRVVSALQLERHLRYERLAWIEAVETATYQGVAVALVVAGYGVWSLIWAVLVRGLVGTTLIYLAAPWRVRLVFNAASARSILRYGIPFQLEGLSDHISDWIIPLFVAAGSGPQAVGFLGFASANGKRPLVLADIVLRVAFPHFSRIQHDRIQVERLLTRYLTYLLVPAGLWFAVLLTAGPSLVQWIYSNKWVPAVPALIIFAAALCFEVVMWVMRSVLNSLGRPGFSARIVLLQSLAYIGLSILLVAVMGYNGVAVAYLLSFAATAPMLFGGMGRGALRRLLAPSVWIVVPVVTGFLVGEVVVRFLFDVELRAVLTTSAVTLSYLGAAWLASPRWLKEAGVARLGRYHMALARK